MLTLNNSSNKKTDSKRGLSTDVHYKL